MNNLMSENSASTNILTKPLYTMTHIKIHDHLYFIMMIPFMIIGPLHVSCAPETEESRGATQTFSPTTHRLDSISNPHQELEEF